MIENTKLKENSLEMFISDYSLLTNQGNGGCQRTKRVYVKLFVAMNAQYTEHECLQQHWQRELDVSEKNIITPTVTNRSNFTNWQFSEFRRVFAAECSFWNSRYYRCAREKCFPSRIPGLTKSNEQLPTKRELMDFKNRSLLKFVFIPRKAVTAKDLLIQKVF